MNGKAGTTNKRRGSRGKKTNRTKPKTADELDAEMTDYFGGVNGTTETNGVTTQTETANGGNAGDDEIQVCVRDYRNTLPLLMTGQ